MQRDSNLCTEEWRESPVAMQREFFDGTEIDVTPSVVHTGDARAGVGRQRQWVKKTETISLNIFR